MDIQKIVKNSLKLQDGIWQSDSSGYWSNIDKEQMGRFLEDLDTIGSLAVVRKHFPQHEEVIFSPQRVGGVGMLDFQATDVVLDAGCMWGALTVPIARMGCKVIGVDQTRDSIRLLKARLDEEGLEQAQLVQCNLNQLQLADESIDKAIVNGVLEWLAEGTIELDSYQKNIPSDKTSPKKTQIDKTPYEIQLDFLSKINRSLKKDGLLYLAIENRFDLINFIGAKDPHTGQRFITIWPRFVQEFMAKIFTGRSYLTWTYSRTALHDMLTKAGFNNIEFRYAFSNYRLPELILTDSGMKLCKPLRHRTFNTIIHKVLLFTLETVFYRWLRCSSLAPAFIVIAKKQ
ncbi:MAG: class I SAM-dependent methyltransferase [Magnetococcales bacterium]|nr:class I SAM-dependent methyltransferase [Magnetococcales bacterium]